MVRPASRRIPRVRRYSRDNTTRRSAPSPTGLSPTPAPRSSGVRLTRTKPAKGRSPPPCHPSIPPSGSADRLDSPDGFGLLPVRSPLLGESFLFLGVLRCFSSPGAPPPERVPGYHPRRVAPFGDLGIAGCQRLPRAFRRVAASFLGRQRLGIHRAPIFAASSAALAAPRSRRRPGLRSGPARATLRRGPTLRARPTVPSASGAVRGWVRCGPLPIRCRSASRVPCSMCRPARPTVVEPPRGDPPAPGCPAANTPSTGRPGSRGRTSRRPGRDPVAPVRLSRYPRRAGHEAGTARPGSPPVGWSRGDSNPGPPPCKGGALPAKLRPRSESAVGGRQSAVGGVANRLPVPPVGWARLDSNQGPRPYQGRALTA